MAQIDALELLNFLSDSKYHLFAASLQQWVKCLNVWPTHFQNPSLKQDGKTELIWSEYFCTKFQQSMKT